MTPDETLVAQATAGDQDAFNQLVKRWERPIFALAYRTLGREEEARDVVQDAFLRAYRGLAGFKGEAKFSSWLYRITLNLCRDLQRKERRTPLVQVAAGDDDAVDIADRQPAPMESVEDLVDRRQMSEAVKVAMSELPEEQRMAIMLKEYHGLTFQEIADQLGCPLSTVKTRLYQGLSVLRRRLERQQAEVTALRRATWESSSS
jgi:RNA polymerase sigma-70 factor, ECF subfamily